MTASELEDLSRRNLITALEMLTEQFKRYNDANEKPKITNRVGEAEYGRAEYGNRSARDAADQLNENFSAQIEEQNRFTPPRKGKRGAS